MKARIRAENVENENMADNQRTLMVRIFVTFRSQMRQLLSAAHWWIAAAGLPA